MKPIAELYFSNMKLTPRVTVTLLGFAATAIVLTCWSARLGREVWSPEVFAWRNPLKPRPNIEQPADCPLFLSRPRFYSFMSPGSSIGSTIRFDVKNVSRRAIRSFGISIDSSDPLDKGEFGVEPRELLEPEQNFSVGWSSRAKQLVTVRVNFVKFANGEFWGNPH